MTRHFDTIRRVEQRRFAEKAEHTRLLPSEYFDIVDWQGTRKNVQAEVVSVYRHLASCPFRHSDGRLDLIAKQIEMCHAMSR